MKKKKIIIAAIAVILLVVIIAVIIININKGKVKLFTDSNYPCMYKSKDNSIVFRLKDKNNSDIPWQIEEDGGIVDASVKNDGKGRKAVYTLSAKAPGMTELRLYKTKELSGFEVEVVSVRIPINISENESGMVLNVFGSPTLTDNGGGVGGKNTDNPYILVNNGDGTAKVVFVNGQNDWRVSDSSNMASLEWNISDDSYDSCQISENPDYDPDAEVTTEETTEYVESDASEENGPEDTDADNSESASKGTGEKPDKTAKDIENMTISDEDYENGSIDLSEYLVDGEIPEDVLEALDKKFAEKAKEMGDDTYEESTEESLENTGDASNNGSNNGNKDSAGSSSYDSTQTGTAGNNGTSGTNADTTDNISTTDGNSDPTGLGATIDYSGLYETYDDSDSSSEAGMGSEATDNEASDGESSDAENGDASSEDGYTIDPETGELIIDEEALKNREAEKINVVKETILTVSSEQYHSVEYIKVSFMSDGNIMLSVSKKGPKK